ncbi:MAG: phosphoribosylformylglycinamidine cyclo-ligase [Acidobacteriota bacterium]
MATEYEKAGVSIDAQDEAIGRIKKLVRPTFTAGVKSDIGRFGGLFQLPPGKYAEPLLVSSTDGVGTKLKIAYRTGIHDTVGYDLVSHCVNDILTQGAEPLFFLDYIACNKLVPDVIEAIIRGMAKACAETGCALIGGELAEMGDCYKPGEYDIAGFIVGVVEKARYLDGTRVAEGDVLIGLGSTGLHTNGYSLARRIFFDKLSLDVNAPIPSVGMTVAQALLQNHRTYLAPLREPLAAGKIHALAHITGGGLTDNTPRALRPGLDARIHRGSWPVPPLFAFMQDKGDVPGEEMYRVFNMGIGMVVIAAAADEAALTDAFRASGETVYRIGEIVPGTGRVVYA